MEAHLEYLHTRCINVFFAHVVPICMYAQSVLINKISASELSRKFLKRALLVGHVIN